MREFIQNHPSYKRDSRVTNEINHDLILECLKVSKGEKEAPELLGKFLMRNKGAFGTKDVRAFPSTSLPFFSQRGT